MDQQYDVIVASTGMKECLLSGLMSCAGKKVLHMDRNNYYGGESASLSLNQLYERFKPSEKPKATLGASREYQVDLIPKFIMAGGDLVQLLVYTGVNRYIEFKKVDGCYVVRQGKVYKVPATDGEAIKSSLLGFFQKRKVRNFFQYTATYDPADPASYRPDLNPAKVTMRAVYEYFGLDEQSIDFIGHCVALNADDAHMDQVAAPTFAKLKLYAESLARYGSSPFLYPLYGLGELPQGFARLSAIYGGTFMLNKPVDELVYDDAGRVMGVKSEGEIARAPVVICDPSYAPAKVRRTGQVVRCICILDHPIPGTDNAESCQVIFGGKELARRSDIYISAVSYAHNVAAAGKWVVLVSTTVETANPLAEIAPALELIGPALETFPSVADTFAPTNDPRVDGVYITNSYDASSHFASATEDVYRIYEQIVGHPVDFNNPPRPGGDEEDGGAEAGAAE
eukprot:a174573_350.p2 GENE.a174573_350~~a174573_350.p2  ORF type:complete len:466 (+),score=231.84 a174573_350:39-1400(+)